MWIRQLSHCPYCKACEIALDDELNLVFDPESKERQPCAHLAWVEGRYSQWGHSDQGVNKVIGSVEFHWHPADPDADARTAALLPYLRDLINSGPKWRYAPSAPYVHRTLSAEDMQKNRRGVDEPIWDVDGHAIYAPVPAEFWAALPHCQEAMLAGLKLEDQK